MPNTLQEFLTASTEKALTELIAAVEALPEAQRSWSPADKGRTALDQAAECAILNGSTAQVIASRSWVIGSDFERFLKDKAELAQDWDRIKTLLQENTA